MKLSILATRVYYEGKNKEQWDELCNNYPWCSEQYNLINNYKRDQLLATILASYIDSLICDFKYTKLKKLLSIPNIPVRFECHIPYIKQLEEKFIKFIDPLKQIDEATLKNIISQSEKARRIKTHLEQQRSYIYESLKNNYEELAKMARILAIIPFFSESYSNITQMEELIRRFSLDNIINSLISGKSIVEKDSIFMVNDYELIPIVFHTKRSIYIYINNPELSKKSIANKEDPDPIIILLEKSDKLSPITSIRILSNSNMKSYQEKHYQKCIKPKYELVEETQNLIQAIIDSLSKDFEKQSLYWINKIKNSINDPSSLKMRVNSIQLEQPMTSLRNFVKKFEFSDNDYLQLKILLVDQLKEKAHQSQKCLFDEIVKVCELLKPELKYSNNRFSDISQNVLSRSISSEKTNKFFKQRQLNNLSKIEAKDISEDLPDPLENWIDDEKKKKKIPFQNLVIEEEPPLENEESMLYKSFPSESEKQGIEILKEDIERISVHDLALPPENFLIKQEVAIKQQNEFSNNIDHKTSQVDVNISEKQFRENIDNFQDISSDKKNGSNLLSQQKKVIQKKIKSRFPSKEFSSQQMQQFINGEFDGTSLIEENNDVRHEIQSLRSVSEIKKSNRKLSLKYQPNNSKKSENILRQIVKSQIRQKQQNNNVQASRITEMDEPVNQSVILEFICPICYNTITQDDEIKQLHDNHQICQACLENWVKVKFNSGQWNLKSFMCPIFNNQNEHCNKNIDGKIIKSVLTPEDFEKLNQAKKQITSKFECPWCQNLIQNMLEINKEALKCPSCMQEICWVCKGQSHDGKMCPMRIKEIKGALEDERIACCPTCLEIYMKNDGCQHVQCHKCQTEFCFACSADREPILGHGTAILLINLVGAHYHRVGCEQFMPWKNPDTNEDILDDEFDPEFCKKCQKNGSACIRPLELEKFKNLVHLNF